MQMARTDASIAARLDRLPSSARFGPSCCSSRSAACSSSTICFSPRMSLRACRRRVVHRAVARNFASSRSSAWRASARSCSRPSRLVVRRRDAGQAADRFGRKAVFTWSLVCTAPARDHGVSALGAMLNIWRFVAGLGFGVQLVTVILTLRTHAAISARRAFSVNQFISFCVVPVVALLAWLIVPAKPLGFDGWRWWCSWDRSGRWWYGGFGRNSGESALVGGQKPPCGG